jgi:hypothetical protein
MSAVIGAAVRCRADNDFDSMNRALDWGMKFMLGNLASSGVSLSESIAMTQKLIQDSPVDDIKMPARVSGSQLSQAELVELGVVDPAGVPS